MPAMRIARMAKKVIVTPLLASAVLYLASASALYAYQRELIYQPSEAPIGAPPRGSIYSALEVNVPDGTHLTVWTVPAATSAHPTLVFFHGNASNVSDFARLGAAFHARGWGVVLAAYRGYSGNTGTPHEEGLYEDGRAVLEAADIEGTVVLWGHSLGSGVAAKLASEGRADALILEAPFTSLADVGAMLYPIYPIEALLTDRFDTTALVPAINMPVLIFHSRDDEIVPFALGEQLAKDFADNARLIALDNVGHIPHRLDLSEATANWLSENGIGNAF